MCQKMNGIECDYMFVTIRWISDSMGFDADLVQYTADAAKVRLRESRSCSVLTLCGTPFG
jgi:hypothetical protein